MSDQVAFWIVFQGNSYKRSSSGGYMWAPKKNKKGAKMHYWENLTFVEPGDTIFSGFSGALRSVSKPRAKAFDAIRPEPALDEQWENEGWRIDLEYTELENPLFYSSWLPAIQTELPGKYSPFNSNGQANQGYMYRLPDSVGLHILHLAGTENIEELEESSISSLDQTARKRMQEARLGQGKFRRALDEVWNRKCAVTEVKRRELLRASHIKPWSLSNDFERLDPNNGLLLATNYDAAFDALLISFTKNGEIVFANDFAIEDAQKIGILKNHTLRKSVLKQEIYLEAHRNLMQARLRSKK